MKVTERVEMFEEENTSLVSQKVYLSRVDVSQDLTQHEIYQQCISMIMEMLLSTTNDDKIDCKILFLEVNSKDDGWMVLLSLFSYV